MHVYVDDKPFAVSDLASKTVRQVANEVNSALAQQGRMLVAVFCDGRLIEPQELQSVLDSPASRFERLDFQSALPAVLAREVLMRASELLDEVSPLLQQAGELLSQGQNARAMELLANCFGVWHQVQDSVAKSSRLLGLDLSKFLIADRPADEMLEEFADRLREVKEALENRDYVMLSDVVQYELPEAAPRWKELLERLIEAVEEQ